MNVIFKDHWGRPRPRQVQEFGGAQDYRRVWQPNFFDQPEPSKSFVCGHCSTGFFFFAFAIVGRRLRRRRLELFGWLTGASLGFWLSLTRIAQGGHFFSDTVLLRSVHVG